MLAQRAVVAVKFVYEFTRNSSRPEIAKVVSFLRQPLMRTFASSNAPETSDREEMRVIYSMNFICFEM